MSENEHLMAIKRTIAEMEFALIPDYYNDSSLENIAGLNKKIEGHAEALAREMAEAEAQRDILRTHSEGMVPLYNDLERRLAEAEARVGRFRRHAELAEHVADMMAIGTEAEYNEADRKLEASRSQLYEHGDLPDAAGEGSEA